MNELYGKNLLPMGIVNIKSIDEAELKKRPADYKPAQIIKNRRCKQSAAVFLWIFLSESFDSRTRA
ncbi:MAG TPA: hypothetical protein DCO79_00375 [Spirochaeta sp.]|nr:hypothetical protein [Spirochaeta sp.]